MLDVIKRKLFIRYELRRLILRSALRNRNMSVVQHFYIMYLKTKPSRFVTIGQKINRCTLTGRSDGISPRMQISRFVFRRETNGGNLPGFRRIS
jgi:ribosomal protein S14